MTHKLIKIAFFSACATVVSMFTLAADPCISGDTLAQYEALTSGCQIGDKIFSNFTYSGIGTGGGSTVDASGIVVDTVGPGQTVGGPNYGLQFNGSWTASGAGATSDGDIGFTVTVINGAGMAITDAGLAQTSGVNGSGASSVAELGCSGTSCTPGTWAVLTFEANGGTTIQGSSETFLSPTGSVTVSKDINAIAGNGTGFDFASISLVTDTFSQSPVPEPRALSLLLGLGLVAGFAFRKKFQGVRA